MTLTSGYLKVDSSTDTEIMYKHPYERSRTDMTVVRFFDYGNDNKKNTVVIKYVPMNQWHQSDDFVTANSYWQKVLSVDTSGNSNKKTFLLELGKLMHWMINLCPVERGNSACMEWLARAAAMEKGVNRKRHTNYILTK